MIVASGAGNCQSEENGSQGINPIRDVFGLPFFGNGSGFGIDTMIAAESSGDLLVQGGIGKHVACELIRDESVVRKIVVESADQPIPPDPLIAVAVILIAIGIGVAGGLQPRGSHVFAIAWRGEKAVDEFLVGLWRGIGKESGNFLRGSGKAGEVEADPADECFFGSAGRGVEIVFAKALLDESVDALGAF